MIASQIGAALTGDDLMRARMRFVKQGRRHRLP